MAHVYVYSGAAGGGTGADWTNAYTSLATAFAAKAAGDNFWIAHDHASTIATALTLTSPGTAASPCTAICVNRAGSVPPVSADLRTTATITTTGNSNIAIEGFCHYQGITFNAGTGANSTIFQIGSSSDGSAYFKNCALNKLGTTFGSVLYVGFGGGVAWDIVLDNTTVGFANTSDQIAIASANFYWKNTVTPFTGTLPSGVAAILAYCNGTLTLEALDFSAAAFNNMTLIGATGGGGAPVIVKNCRTNATGFVVAETPANPGGCPVNVIRSASGATNYTHDAYRYQGTQTVETTIVRTGGASDGVTPISWKIATNANANRLAPFRSMPMSIKNNTTGANVTVNIFGTWGGGAVPTNAQIWPVISYMGSSGSPIATIVSGGPADYLAAGSNWATDGSTWGGGTTKFKMAVTLSSPQPAMTGPIDVWIEAAKTSDTFYIDQKIVLT